MTRRTGGAPGLRGGPGENSPDGGVPSSSRAGQGTPLPGRRPAASGDAGPGDTDPAERARGICLRLLTGSARTRKQLGDALRAKEIPDEVAEEVLSRFEEVGLIDDAAFAATLTTSRSRFSGRGKMRIRQELRQKGIDPETAEEALAEVSADDELEAARAVAAKRARSLEGLERVVAQRRLAGVLARRGFSPGVVMQVVQETLIS
ncbi:MAG TPA: recombination regulator RecX [Janibacter terrae]|nr:recombination regulator RecX [Janibacter terrae]